MKGTTVQEDKARTGKIHIGCRVSQDFRDYRATLSTTAGLTSLKFNAVYLTHLSEIFKFPKCPKMHITIIYSYSTIVTLISYKLT